MVPMRSTVRSLSIHGTFHRYSALHFLSNSPEPDTVSAGILQLPLESPRYSKRNFNCRFGYNRILTRILHTPICIEILFNNKFSDKITHGFDFCIENVI